MAWVLIALAVAMILVGWALRSRRTLSRFLVARASLLADGIKGVRLHRRVSALVTPVRLVGVGGATARLDTGLLDEQPLLEIGDTTAQHLKTLTKGTAYLLYHPVWVEVWQRVSGPTYRRVVALERLELHKEFEYVVHDPDGLGATDQRFSATHGTIKISVTPRLHLYLEALLKPEPVEAGPAARRGFS